MAAPEGNTNAEQWTLEKAQALFDQAKAYSIADDYDFVGEIAKKCGAYIDIFTYLVKKFPELKSDWKQIKRNCESNCFSNAKKGTINPSVAIMNLKANYNWSDRTDVTSKGKKVEVPSAATTIVFKKFNDGEQS